MKFLGAVFLFLLVLASVFSCEPEEDVLTTKPEAILQFSADSVQFDTVFTQIPSVTKRLWVYNFNKNAVEISEISLGLGSASPYKLVINGQPISLARHLRIRGQDSLAILVQVLIPEGSVNTPFLVADVLNFLVNGQSQAVPLVSTGQNAVFHKAGELGCNTVWTADKPHLLSGTVVVKAGCTLTIGAGARVYAHDQAVLWVDGTLHVAGTAAQRVIFDGDRLEPFYNDVPGQWTGLRFSATSLDNQIRYADLNNAVVGIQVQSLNQPAGSFEVKVDNSIIRNMYTAGLLSYGADVQLTNTLVTNCGQYAVAGFGGGTYEFRYCTFANFTPEFNRSTPSFSFSDRRKGENGQNLDADLKITMVNSILYSGKRGGRLTEEMLIQNEAGKKMELTFTRNILQTERYAPTLGNTNQYNQDPVFKSTPDRLRPVYPFDYSLDDASPANGAALPLPAVSLDLLDKPRDPLKPDMGAYERP